MVNSGFRLLKQPKQLRKQKERSIQIPNKILLNIKRRQILFMPLNQFLTQKLKTVSIMDYKELQQTLN